LISERCLLRGAPNARDLGQAYYKAAMHEQLPKISRVRELIDTLSPDCELEVDGGIDGTTAALAIEAGANVLVAGSAVFGSADRAEAIERIRTSKIN